MDNSNEQQQLSPTTTVGELRKQHGPHFAAGYGDQDPIGEVFGRAGVTTLEEYLAQNQKS
jgi:hypothetical protein